MKTLDEVIENLGDGTEHLCAMLISKETWGDALQYLKEYKIKRNMIFTRIQACDNREKRLQEEIARYCEAVRNCEVAELKYRQLAQDLCEDDNPALSWDELKSMKGKPVWIECKFYSHQWAIIGEVCEDRIRFYGHHLVDGEPKSEIGKIWQAYRKERE